MGIVLKLNLLNANDEEVLLPSRKLKIRRSAGPKDIHPTIFQSIADVFHKSIRGPYYVSLRLGEIPAD